MVKNKRISVWARALTALVLACVLASAGLAALPGRALAAEVNQPDASAGLSLTVKDQHDDTFHAGTQVRVWRVANVAGDGALAPVGDFASLPVSWDVAGEADMRVLAATLEAYVMRDGFAPTDVAATDANGVAAFPTKGALEPGCYLVLADAHKVGGEVHRPAASLVELPYAHQDGLLEYAPVVSLKYEAYSGPFVLDATKVWKGENPNQPNEVRVQLLRDGEVWRTATLNEANGWHATWTGLDPAHAWGVLEEDVPDGYTVSVKKDGSVVSVVNTCKDAGEEGSKQGGSKGSPGGGSAKLPQTGQLWWPVVVLLMLGVVLLFAGLSRKMRR